MRKVKFIHCAKAEADIAYITGNQAYHIKIIIFKKWGMKRCFTGPKYCGTAARNNFTN